MCVYIYHVNLKDILLAVVVKSMVDILFSKELFPKLPSIIGKEIKSNH